MRPIKVRVPIYNKGVFQKFNYHEIAINAGSNSYAFGNFILMGKYEVKEPQLFTGREDAQINGTEVYEGDIIQNCDTKSLEVVYWNEQEAAWYCKYIDDNRIISLADSLGNLNKVIGNIHETKQ